MSARGTRTTHAASRPRTGAPRPAWVAAFCLGAFPAGCEPAAPSAAPESVPLERFAFVPPARVALSSGLEAASEKPLLVGQFEVTRGEWRAWYLAQEQADADARARVEAWDPASFDWPASFLSLLEAREYARGQGMRLLSWSEWLRTACGSAAAPYPWGPNDVASVANTLELGLRVPTPVGTFEQGRTQNEIYDMLGNVWEWVDDAPGPRAPFAWAMGGSYLTLRAPLFPPRADLSETLHLELDAAGRSIDVGLRVCTEARP